MVRCLQSTLFFLFLSPALCLGLDLYIMGSMWEPSDTERTFGYGAGVSLPMITDYLRLDGRVYFFEENDQDNDESFELIPVDLGLQIHLEPDNDFNPYLLAGISYMLVDGEQVDIDDDFGGYFGAGLEYGLNKTFRLFGEAQYRIAELGSERTLFDDVNVSGFAANFGFKIHL
ncbi:porin family protein [bacterium]|nr:porin family protein [bacterium]